MKIKCPGCATVLNIPETAAGKVVKCPCGKQLRAPGASAPAARPAPAPGGAPAAKRPTPQRPTPQRPAAQGGGFGGLDADMFDELTDGDLKPVSAVARPGVAKQAAPTSTSGKLMQQYGPSDVGGGSAKGSKATGDRPGTLTFLGVINALWALLYFGLALALFGLMSLIPAMGEEMPDEEGGILVLAGLALITMAVLSVATTVACFLARPACWMILLFSYSYGLGDRIMGAVGMLSDDGEGARIGGAVIGIVVGLLFLAYMHGEEVRAFHGTTDASPVKMIVPDILGLISGLGLGYAAVFMSGM